MAGFCAVKRRGHKVRILPRFSGPSSWKEARRAKADCGVLLWGRDWVWGSSVRHLRGHGCLQKKNGVGALPGTKHKINSNGSEAWI